MTPTLRLTAQVTPRNKLSLFWDAGAFRFSNPPSAGSSTSSPETGTVQPGNGSSRLQQLKWTSTLTNRLLLEAGLGTYQQNWNGRERPGNDRSLIRVVEQCAGGCPDNGGIAGLTYRAQNWNTDYMSPNRWFTSATYVTGAHSMKVGYQGVFHWNTSFPSTNDHNLQYRFNNGVPNQLTQNLSPYRTDERTRYHALFAQDQWTRGKLTLQGALRYDHAWSYYPAQQIGPTRFLPEGLYFPETQGRAWLQRHQPADGSGLRPVRQRENGPQVQRGPVSRSGGQRQRELLRAQAGLARPNERDADLDRRQPQLRRRIAI